MGRPYDHDSGSDSYSASIRRLDPAERARIAGKLLRLADALFMRPEHAADLDRIYKIRFGVEAGSLLSSDVPYLKRLFDEHKIT